MWPWCSSSSQKVKHTEPAGRAKFRGNMKNTESKTLRWAINTCKYAKIYSSLCTCFVLSAKVKKHMHDFKRNLLYIRKQATKWSKTQPVLSRSNRCWLQIWTRCILLSFTQEHWILNTGYVCVCNFKSPSKATIARSYLAIQIHDKEIAIKIFLLSNLINHVKYSPKRNRRIYDTDAKHRYFIQL